MFVEGAANLVTGEEDRERLQDMLRTLEEKEKVVKLLGAYLDTRQEAVRVVIGLDEALPSMQQFRPDWRSGARGRRSDGVAGGDWTDAAGLSAHHVGGVVHRAPVRQTFE